MGKYAHENNDRKMKTLHEGKENRMRWKRRRGGGHMIERGSIEGEYLNSREPTTTSTAHTLTR